ncbi:MAG: hypothetical protein ACI92W_003078, partial [Paraglaciecola sp.]
YHKRSSEVGDEYFEVKYVNTLSLTDFSDSTVTRSQDRFLEINVNEEGGMKIVSNYTTFTDPDLLLKEWWSSMNSTWQHLFLQIASVDTMSNASLRMLVGMDSLSIAGRLDIKDLSPLLQLRKLKYLNISETSISDLQAIRYANNLRYLDFSSTQIGSLDIVAYLPRLSYLDVSYCQTLSSIPMITSLEELLIKGVFFDDYQSVGTMKNLQRLDASGSTLMSAYHLSQLLSLTDLNLSNTSIGDWDIEENLPALINLNISGTDISTLIFINQLPELEYLNINHTSVDDLTPLSDHKQLKKVLADFTNLDEKHVQAFMANNQDILVLTQTDLLLSWWNDLPFEWQEALSEAGELRSSQLIEDLVIFLQTDSLDIQNLPLTDGAPLQRFTQLRFLDISNSDFESISFCKALTNLEVLIANKVPINSLNGIQQADRLSHFEASDSYLDDIGILSGLSSLTYIRIERSKVIDQVWTTYLNAHEDQDVIYQTDRLETWWDNIDGGLKQVLKGSLSEYSPEGLHRMVRAKRLQLMNVKAENLYQLSVFQWLETLDVRQSPSTFIPDLSEVGQIKTLSWTEGPLVSLSALSNVPGLERLTISNTAVVDLDEVSGLVNLRELDCSSTQIKSLKPLTRSKSLKTLNISNTRVWQLNWLYDIRGIESLICFNSRVSDNKLDQFKERFPSCVITNF